jgi:hypothetical protein
MQSGQGDRVSSLVMLSEFRSGNIHLSRSLSWTRRGSIVALRPPTAPSASCRLRLGGHKEGCPAFDAAAAWLAASMARGWIGRRRGGEQLHPRCKPRGCYSRRAMECPGRLTLDARFIESPRWKGKAGQSMFLNGISVLPLNDVSDSPYLIRPDTCRTPRSANSFGTVPDGAAAPPRYTRLI